ncbi:hypothetical protein [Natronococcus occultus]|uniref:hypothetical protein n=1 Tax=Natronococcus occultus TaxID=29288 RepID=UPI0012FBC5BF|nr:hypothetical protein [Natronococcus occultus]
MTTVAPSQNVLPPRSGCPDCGTRTLAERSLSDTATTRQQRRPNSTPELVDETPYTVAVVPFDDGVFPTG